MGDSDDGRDDSAWVAYLSFTSSDGADGIVSVGINVHVSYKEDGDVRPEAQRPRRQRRPRRAKLVVVSAERRSFEDDEGADGRKNGEGAGGGEGTPKQKVGGLVRSFLLGRFTTNEQQRGIEVERRPPPDRQEQYREEREYMGRRERSVDGDSSAKTVEEEEWEERYKGIFLADDNPMPFTESVTDLKDDVEKVSLAIFAVIVLGFLFKALLAFGQFLFNFTFSFFAIFLLSAGIFVFFALARF